MNSFEEGRAYVDDASIILAEAEESLGKGHFHRAVRKCQESVELALKGLLRMYGVEYPNWSSSGGSCQSPRKGGDVACRIPW